MNTDLKHGLLTQQIIGVFYDVYNELGHGFLESVYQKSLVLALTSTGLRVCSPVEIPVWFRGIRVGSFEADALVEDCVLLELKAMARTSFEPPSATVELSESHGNRGWAIAEFRREA